MIHQSIVLQLRQSIILSVILELVCTVWHQNFLHLHKEAVKHHQQETGGHLLIHLLLSILVDP